MSIDEVMKLNLEEEDKKRKIYFQEWLQSKNEIELFIQPKDLLIADLNKYIKTKKIKNETPAIQRD